MGRPGSLCPIGRATDRGARGMPPRLDNTRRGSTPRTPLAPGPVRSARGVGEVPKENGPAPRGRGAAPSPLRPCRPCSGGAGIQMISASSRPCVIQTYLQIRTPVHPFKPKFSASQVNAIGQRFLLHPDAMSLRRSSRRSRGRTGATVRQASQVRAAAGKNQLWKLRRALDSGLCCNTSGLESDRFATRDGFDHRYRSRRP